MAFPKGSGVVFYGDAVTAISQAAAIASTVFSAGTITALTQESTDVAVLADAVLDVTMLTSPTVNPVFYLYRRDKNVSGSNHAPTPSAAYKSIFVGAFKLALVATQQFIKLADIPLSPDQEFYLENGTDKSTTGTTVLTVKPKTYGPRA